MGKCQSVAVLIVERGVDENATIIWPSPSEVLVLHRQSYGVNQFFVFEIISEYNLKIHNSNTASVLILPLTTASFLKMYN